MIYLVEKINEDPKSALLGFGSVTFNPRHTII